MGIYYIFTIIILLFSFFIIKKSEKKLNLITWLIISIISLLCYQVLICYILNLINVNSNLITLGAINTIISVLMLYYSIKYNKYQRYFINKKELVIILMLLVFSSVICKLNYKSLNDIKYDTTDPANHFMASLEFYRNSKLLNKIEQNEVYDYATMMPASYINTGILFKIISTFNNNEINLYKAYILMDCFMIYLSCITFFYTIKNNLRGKEKTLISLFITILFIVGYPLTSAIFGFAYLSLGLIIIQGILLCMPIIYRKKFFYIPKIIIMFLLTFGLFFSYYFFAPVIFASIGIFLLSKYIQERKIFTLKNIIEIIIVLIIPCICGFCYFVLPSIIAPETTFKYDEAITAEGHIYRDLYSNFLVLIPFSIYYFINMLRRKKIKIENIIFIFLILFAIILFAGGMMRKSFIILFL